MQQLNERMDNFQSISLVDAVIEGNSGKQAAWRAAGGAVPWEGTDAADVAQESYTQSYNTGGFKAPHIIFVMADDLGTNDVGYVSQARLQGGDSTADQPRPILPTSAASRRLLRLRVHRRKLRCVVVDQSRGGRAER